MVSDTVLVYERVLTGEHWPERFVGSPKYKDRGLEIMSYVFFDKLKVKNYEEAKRLLNTQFIRKHRLLQVVRCFEKPVEMLPEEYDYILWELFPNRRKGKRALAIKTYSDVLTRKRHGFPHGFFSDADWGRFRAEACVKHLCKNILHLSGDRIAWEFSHSDGINTLSKYRLKGVLSSAYSSLSDMMYQVYPQYCDKLEHYQSLRDRRHFRTKKGGKENRNC